MTIAVDLGRKATKQANKTKNPVIIHKKLAQLVPRPIINVNITN